MVLMLRCTSSTRTIDRLAAWVLLVASVILVIVVVGATAAVVVKDDGSHRSMKEGTMDYDATNFQDCSSHCGSEHEGERMEQKLCVELCRLMFDFPTPASSVMMSED